jgi:hypothetical protein
MAISTNGTVLARVAGALYNTQMSNATYKEVAALDPSALADVLYARDFSASTDAAVATILVTNLGLSAVTGLDNWVAAQLTAAGTHKGAKIVELLNGFAQMTADTTYGAYATAFNTKVDAALALSQTTDNAGGTFAAAGTAAPANLSFVLTSSVNSFTGGVGNDTFTADNTATADVTSTADALNGGAGSDNLDVFSDGAAGAMPTLTSIETVNVYDQDDALDVSANSWSSVTTLNLIRGNGAIVTVGESVATVGLSDITVPATDTTTDDIVINFEDARTTATLNLSGVNGTAADLLEDIEVNGEAMTTANVNVTGASSFDALDLDAATTINLTANAAFTLTGLASTGTATLNISGSGAVNIGTLDADIDTVTSTATGALTADIGANVDTVLTAGSGNDVITASSTDTIATTDALAVNGGEGSDTLIISAAADVSSTADGARYTNFEKVRLSDSYDGDFIAGITALQLAGATSKSYTDLTATQAANIQVRGDETSPTFALKTATGTSDELTLTMGTGTTTSAATAIVTGMTVTGFETLNIVENGGATATAGANRTATIAAFTGATLNDINLSGRAVTLSNIATTVAVNIDGSALTGNATATSTDAQGLTVDGSAVAGSVINGSAVRDKFTVGAEGSTYNGGAGNDLFVATVALIAADGSTDLVLNGEAGTDKLTLTDTTTTLADTHFTNLIGFESLALSNTAGDASITTGAAFNAAFASGATITTGTLAATKDVTIAAGLSTVALKITVDATSLVGTAAEANSITTGSAGDTVTFTGDATYVGVAGATQGTIVIDTRGGNDTISVTVGTLLASTGGQAMTITGGAGQDSITKVGVNSTTVTSVAHYAFAAGDSSTTAWDSITGFDVSDGTALSDGLNFEGTSAVSAFTATEDFGLIKSHSITAGIVQFDDVADYSTALKINTINLADVIGYLKANVAANGTVAFAYDSDDSGSADATMVFHQGSASSVADDLVLLVGITGVDALIATNTAGANDLFIA